MALHTETKIYKHAYQLLNLSIEAKANMRRDFKNSLGSRIHDECIEVLVLIADANAAPNSDKPSVIRQMLRHIGKIEFLLRVCNDQRLITPRVWASAIELLQSIGSQGGGWANYFERTKAPAA